MALKIDDDIAMKEISYNFITYHTSFLSNFRPRKRTYLDMLHNSSRTLLNNRTDNYKLCQKSNEILSLCNSINNKNKNQNTLLKNLDVFDGIKNAKKNLMIKRNYEFDEEKEKMLVENYYRIKNAELNKLRFGI